MKSVNITTELRERALRSPKSLALISSIGELSYFELDYLVDHCARCILELGVMPGEVIGLSFRDETTLAIVFLAAARIGAPTVCFSQAATSAQIQRWSSEVNLGRQFTDYRRSAPDSVVFVTFDVEMFRDTLAQVRQGISSPCSIVLSELPTLTIVVGSGTTGAPKLIPISHQHMRHRILDAGNLYDFSPTDRVATLSHLEYAAGKHRLLAAIFFGASFVTLSRDQMTLLELRDKVRVTILSATVFHVEQIFRAIRQPMSRVLAGVRLAISGSTVSGALRVKIRKYLTEDFWISYGCNESWIVSVANPSQVLSHPGTVGKVVPSVTVEIIDATGNEVAVGTVGLLRIKGPGTVGGYLGEDLAGADVFCEGWFVPGDMGKLTIDGHLIFCGRADDLMIFNGINIFPAEIESCLLSHPAVVEVAVAPWRHPTHQDIPVALVRVDRGSCVTEGELLGYASEQLGASRPHRIVFVDEIPRTSQGKLIRDAIQRLIADGV